METTTSQIDSVISAEEIAIVREAAAFCGNDYPFVDIAVCEPHLQRLAERWRAIVPSEHGRRLVETYVAMYPSLEESKGIGGVGVWGSRESKTVLLKLMRFFPTDSERWFAVQEALEFSHWKRNRS